jgi:hypothetical protein
MAALLFSILFFLDALPACRRAARQFGEIAWAAVKAIVRFLSSV